MQKPNFFEIANSTSSMSDQSEIDSVVIAKGPSGRIRGLRNLLRNLSREDVVGVLPTISNGATSTGYSDSIEYDLVYKDATYPPKAALGLAAAAVIGRPLFASEFSGGANSPCFDILTSLGFEIRRKNPGDEPLYKADSLERFQLYDRKEIGEVFEPGTPFTRGAGRWGIPGIVETPKESGNFVLIVTLGEAVEGNPYKDEITVDGYLIWESQNKQDFSSPAIVKFLAHDPLERNIHLFIRPNAKAKYRYFGVLAYHSHDENKQNPVHIIWRIENWDIGREDLKRMELPFRENLEPTFSVATSPRIATSIVQVEAPSTGQRRKPRSQRNASPKPDVDWAMKDLRNRQLGLSGEKLILKYEIESLEAAGLHDLARRVRHEALNDSSAGYDILSFSHDGQPKRIEVKTTQGPATTPFYISINEVLASRDFGDSYAIYRVFEHGVGSETARFFVLPGDVELSCDLEAVNFRARPT